MVFFGYSINLKSGFFAYNSDRRVYTFVLVKLRSHSTQLIIANYWTDIISTEATKV